MDISIKLRHTCHYR